MKLSHEIGRKVIGGFAEHEHYHPTGEQICLNCGKLLNEIIKKRDLYCKQNLLKKSPMEINKIICGDAITELKKIPDNNIDLILTDPPYNIDISKYKILTDSRKRQFIRTGDMPWNEKNYFDLKEKSEILFEELNRVLKQTGSVLIFGPQEWAYYYYEPAIKNHFNLKCQIIWEKSNPIPQLRKKNYRSAHENIIWFVRYNQKKVLFTFNWLGQKEMKNIFKTPLCQGEERTKHPTQKPLSLIERLIQIHSNEGNIVLDCFLGSGTTAVACKKLNRNYIGIDISPEYCKIAEQRIKK